MYIGKTTAGLKGRMTSYANPGPTQNTNIRVNNNLKQRIAAGEIVEIWLLDSWDPVTHHGIPVSVPAGIESTLIARLRPEWNNQGKQHR